MTAGRGGNVRSIPFVRSWTIPAIHESARIAWVNLGIRLEHVKPRHEPPASVLATLRDNLHRLGTYPSTAGLPELRAACAQKGLPAPNLE